MKFNIFPRLFRRVILLALAIATLFTIIRHGAIAQSNCDAAYPDVCIPSPPPDLDCSDIPYRNFRVLPPDPHHFDGGPDRRADGIGCETPAK